MLWHRPGSCSWALFTERGPVDAGQHRGRSTDTSVSPGARVPFGMVLVPTHAPSLGCLPRGPHVPILTHTPATTLHIDAAANSKDPHRSILQQESQDLVTNSVVRGYFSGLPNFFRIGNPDPVVLTNRMRKAEFQNFQKHGSMHG